MTHSEPLKQQRQTLTARELGELMGYTEQWIRKLARAGRILSPIGYTARTIRTAKRFRNMLFSGPEVAEWMKDGCPDPKTWEAHKREMRMAHRLA